MNGTGSGVHIPSGPPSSDDETPRQPVRGAIFDMDGTLVDSRLDFAAMRAEMDLPPGTPILEALSQLPPGPRKDRCCEILARHEAEGVRRAAAIPGAVELTATLQRHGIPHAILTRNAREPARAMLQALGLTSYSPVLAREDAPAKPDPAGILRICEEWEIQPSEAVMIGDFRFDVEAGRDAGTSTILLARQGRPDFADLADFVISSLDQAIPLILGR